MSKKKNNDKKIYFIIFSITLFLGIYFSIAPVSAGLLSPSTYTDSTKASQNLKEQQLWEKIKVIKSVFGKAVDNVALFATIVYGESAQGIVNDEYDEEFQKDNYKKSIKSLKEAMYSSSSDSLLNPDDSTTKLIAALIVMLDSDGVKISEKGIQFGIYSDDKYKKALAGSNLVGNLKDNDFWNILFCSTGVLAETLVTFPQLTIDIFAGNGSSAIEKKINRYVTMESVCSNGYIAGAEYNIRNISDEEQKQYAKDKYAQGIIDLAEEYRYFFGKSSNSTCDDVTTGDVTNWRQCGASWSDQSLGGVSSICQIGCAATSVAYLIKISGTRVTEAVDPGVFVNKSTFDGYGNLYWNSWKSLAPYFASSGGSHSIAGETSSSIVDTIKDELNSTDGGKHLVIIQMTNHWVAVDHIENEEIYVLDPAAEAGVGLVTLDTALNRGGKSRNLLSYSVFVASDVVDGDSSSSDFCNSGLEALSEFITKLEGGGNTCNYNGQGDDSGYTTSILSGDAGGLTAANGMTLGTGRRLANDIGYTSFESDMYAGCVDKEKLHQMQLNLLQELSDGVQSSADERGITLTTDQLMALTSVRYGGYGMDTKIMDSIVASNYEDVSVFSCFVTLGCGFGNANYMDGLSNRRAAEYEIYRTGNYNAANLGLGYNTYQMYDISNATLKTYMDTYWPSGQ